MSIKKIAEMTGTSPSTVSRVLNHPEYKCSVPGLRERIWQAAMELNYTPNESARNLKKGNSAKGTTHYFIEILITQMDGQHYDPYYEEQLRAVESQVHKDGCILSRIWYQSIFSDYRKCDKTTVEKIIHQMTQDRTTPCDGLVIIGRCYGAVIKKLKPYYKSIVSINRSAANDGVDVVLCDGRKTAALAVNHLIELGHRKLAYVGQCHNEPRYYGYCDVLRAAGLDFEPGYIIDNSPTEQDGFLAMQKFLKAEDPPTGIYCATDITAIGMLRCLSQYGNALYHPAIIASDDIEQGQFSKPMLSTVHLPKDEMARFALYLLLDRIHGQHRDYVRMELEGSLLLRSSCFQVSEVTQPEYYI